MKIIFSNNKEFEYNEAYAIERDFKNGYTRPSIEIFMPLQQTSYEEINEILNNINSFTLIGNEEPIFNEVGEVIGFNEAPVNIYEDYTIKGKVSIEDDIISFKLYRLSDIEIENRNALAAIDELLMIMEA